MIYIGRMVFEIIVWLTHQMPFLYVYSTRTWSSLYQQMA